MQSNFPESAAERDLWIVERRPPRAILNPRRPYACFMEEERSVSGQIEPVATILLTNRECPFRCTMCDLWRNTLTETVPAGAIPEQIDFALEQLGAVRVVKLYNSGSFFDPRAIPPEDYPAIAERVRAFERVIVECHPAFVGDACLRFRDLLAGPLEIAIGLETVEPEVLNKLNKRMALDHFAAAASFLRRHAIDLRTFILVQPPFMRPDEAFRWAQRSLDFAFECGATAATLIPTRGGNGAMEGLIEAGLFVPPALSLLEETLAYGIGLRRMRVFADLWEVQSGGECTHCFDARVQRLREMNLQQRLAPTPPCGACSPTGEPA